MTYDELLELIAANEEFYGDGTNRTPSWTALRVVVELHKPTADGLGCSYEFVDCHDRSGLGCDVPSTCNQYQSYPCDTIQAIEKELDEK